VVLTLDGPARGTSPDERRSAALPGPARQRLDPLLATSPFGERSAQRHHPNGNAALLNCKIRPLPHRAGDIASALDEHGQTLDQGNRYLQFEKWWGDFVLLGGEEMRWMVDNLFVGNRFSTGQIVTSDGVRLDMREIQGCSGVRLRLSDRVENRG
jgi:hypothetical protein